MANPYTSKIEIRPCNTLGTLWRDIWVDGELFAAEFETEIASTFAARPDLFDNVFDIARTRRDAIERFYRVIPPEMLSPKHGRQPGQKDSK